MLDNGQRLQTNINDARQHPDVYIVGIVQIGTYDFDSHAYSLGLNQDTAIAVAADGGTGVIVQNYADFGSMPMDEKTAVALRQTLLRSDKSLEPLLVVCYGDPRGTGTYLSSDALLDAWRAESKFGTAVSSDSIADQSHFNAVAIHVVQMDIYLPNGEFLQTLKSASH